MGNKLEPETLIQYTTKDGKIVKYPFIELSGESNFPAMPQKERQVTDMFHDWLKKVKVDSKQREQIEQLPIRYKYRMCIKHDIKLAELAAQEKRESKKQMLQAVVDAGLAKPITYFTLQNLKILSMKDEDAVDIFVESDGLNILICALEKFEVKSRNSRNYSTIIALLRIFDMLCGIEKTFSLLADNSKFFIVMCSLIHPLQVEVTSKVLVILSGFCWHSEQCVEYILDGLSQFAKTYGIGNKFDIFVRTIFNSTNIIIVSNMLQFLLSFIGSIIDDSLKNTITRELYEMHIQTKRIDDVLKSVTQRIKSNHYKIEDCTIEQCEKKLQVFRHPLAQEDSILRHTSSYVEVEVQHSFQTQFKPEQLKNSSLSRRASLKTSHSSQPTTKEQEEDNKKAILENCYYLEVGQLELFQEFIQLAQDLTVDILNIEEILKNIEKDLMPKERSDPDQFSNQFFRESILPEPMMKMRNSFGPQNALEKFTDEEVISFLGEKIKQSQFSFSFAFFLKDNLPSDILAFLNDTAVQDEDQIKNLTDKNKLIQNEYDELNRTKEKIQEENLKLKEEISRLQKLTLVIDQGQVQQTQVNETVQLPTLAPPPPPPPILSIPPPPPAPGSGPPPPPPPPGFGGGMQQKPKDKVKQKPSVSMKPLNWTNLNANQTKGSIFDLVNDEKLVLDKKALEDLFQKSNPSVSQLMQSKRISAPVITKIQLLSSDKSKSIELVLGKLKLPSSLIARSLITCDSKILTQTVLQSLKAICPTDEDIKIMKTYDGDISLLAAPEQFVEDVRKVNGFMFRIKALNYIFEYKESIEDISSKLKQLQKVFQSLPLEKRFTILFEQTLAIGNYLNGQSNKGGAYGFKMDTIDKANDVKANDNKSTLLMYIIKQVEQILREPFIKSEDEFFEMEIISKVPITQISIDLSEVKKGLQQIEKAIASKKDDEEDRIDVYLEPFEKEIKNSVYQIEKNYESLNDNFQKCAKFFCESHSDSSEKFGEKLLNMLTSIMKAKKLEEVNSIRQKKEDDNKRREEESKKKEEDKKTKMLTSQVSSIVVEDIIELDHLEVMTDLRKNMGEGQYNRASLVKGEDLKELRNLKINKAKKDDQLKKDLVGLTQSQSFTSTKIQTMAQTQSKSQIQLQPSQPQNNVNQSKGMMMFEKRKQSRQ